MSKKEVKPLFNLPDIDQPKKPWQLTPLGKTHFFMLNLLGIVLGDSIRDKESVPLAKAKFEKAKADYMDTKNALKTALEKHAVESMQKNSSAIIDQYIAQQANEADRQSVLLDLDHKPVFYSLKGVSAELALRDLSNKLMNTSNFEKFEKHGFSIQLGNELKQAVAEVDGFSKYYVVKAADEGSYTDAQIEQVRKRIEGRKVTVYLAAGLLLEIHPAFADYNHEYNCFTLEGFTIQVRPQDEKRELAEFKGRTPYLEQIVCGLKQKEKIGEYFTNRKTLHSLPIWDVMNKPDGDTDLTAVEVAWICRDLEGTYSNGESNYNYQGNLVLRSLNYKTEDHTCFSIIFYQISSRSNKYGVYITRSSGN
jgi:hypothetical protein